MYYTGPPMCTRDCGNKDALIAAFIISILAFILFLGWYLYNSCSGIDLLTFIWEMPSLHPKLFAVVVLFVVILLAGLVSYFVGLELQTGDEWFLGGKSITFMGVVGVLALGVVIWQWYIWRVNTRRLEHAQLKMDAVFAAKFAHLSDEEVEDEIVRMFKEADTDDSKCMDREEFHAAISKWGKDAGRKFQEKEMDMLFDTADYDKGGDIDLDEVLLVYWLMHPSEPFV